MKTWVIQHRSAHVHSFYGSCQQPLTLVPQVGWVLDVRGADTYDVCEANPFGNHAPLDVAAPRAFGDPTRGTVTKTPAGQAQRP